MCVTSKKPLSKSGIDPLGFHQLRHSYASMAMMSGMPLMVLAENLGHRDTRMVERHYGHLMSSYKDLMIEKHAPRFEFAFDADSNVVAMKSR